MTIQIRLQDTVTAAEAAKLLGVTKRSAERMIERGYLEYKIDERGFRRVLRSSLEERIEERGSEQHAKNDLEGLGKIADLLKRSDIDPEDIGKVEKVKLSEWQGMYKDADGNAQVIDMESTSVILSPKWEEGPAWPVVQQADPIVIAERKPRVYPVTVFKTAVILPDTQIGYWKDLVTDELDPFHNEHAMDIAIQLIRDLDPHLIINLGDLLDLAEFGKYQQEPTFAQTTRPSIRRAYRWLVDQKANAPRAEIRLMEGNHDRRMQNYIIQNAKAAFGLQRADLPEEWPVCSVPFLLRLDELDVQYLGGYPANITWINDNLACVHGSKVRSSGSTAAAVIDDERVSVIFGHIHRIELQHKTRQTRDGGKTNFAASIGCLSKTDGTIPSTKGAVDPFGRPLQKAENWQNGLGVVSYKEGDGPFHLEIVPIHHDTAMFRGDEYRSTVD